MEKSEPARTPTGAMGRPQSRRVRTRKVRALLILETSPFLENLINIAAPRRGCGKIAICGELERREDVRAEQGERLVPKTDLSHRIGPAKPGRLAMEQSRAERTATAGAWKLRWIQFCRICFFKMVQAAPRKDNRRSSKASYANRRRFVERVQERTGNPAACNQTKWFAIHVILTLRVRQSTLRSF